MRRPRHQTLIFHRVLQRPDPMQPGEPLADWFDRLVARLVRHFEIVTLDEAARRAIAGRLSGRTLSITFDDGYADNAEVALPILERHGAPATFFVASAFIDGGMMWNDRIVEAFRRLPAGHLVLAVGDAEETLVLDDWTSRHQAAQRVITAWKHLPPVERQQRVDALAKMAPQPDVDLMMTRAQLRAMAASDYAQIGGHTRSHPILAALDDDAARDEILRGKQDLEAIIDRPLRWFAYPNGKIGRDYAAHHPELVRQAGFEGAVSTNWGTMDASTDRFQVPRFTPWHKQLDRFAIDLLRCHYGVI
jgi:peptidoglycan/xylan/chitin deacetylase (PgdA/CDA1 family)